MINNNHSFFIKPNETVEGFSFEAPLSRVVESAGLPSSDEYIVNWHFDDEDIIIDNVEVDDIEVWNVSTIAEWTDDDDNLHDALSHYITNNIL